MVGILCSDMPRGCGLVRSRGTGYPSQQHYNIWFLRTLLQSNTLSQTSYQDSESTVMMEMKCAKLEMENKMLKRKMKEKERKKSRAREKMAGE